MFNSHFSTIFAQKYTIYQTMRKILLTGLLAIILNCFMTAQTAPQLKTDNIDEVLAAMTLEEKATLLVGGANNFFSEGATVGRAAESVPGAAGTTTAIPRLGIPSTILTDGPAGVRINPTRKNDTKTYYATGFPIGTAMGQEVHEYGVDVLLAPGMNLHRNPLCGRNFEYYSEDPVVTGKIAAAYVRGVQAEGAGTSIKHYAVNSQETQRTSVDERVSQRAARELYLKGFEIAVRESQPWTVMSSYNRINGEYSQGSHDLLTKILRDDWGFQGIVMTDWIGIRGDLPVIKEVAAGNDLMEPGQPQQVKAIVEGVQNGSLSMEDVDRNVRRMLEYIVKTPAFKKYNATDTPDLRQHAELTRKVANEGIVLLKNTNGILPFNSNVKKVSLFGISSYHFLSGGTGSGCVHTPYVVDMVTGLNNAGIQSTEELTAVYRKYLEFAKMKFEADRDPSRWFQREEFGQQKYPEMEVSERCYRKEARNADAAIITIGRQAGEGIDRDVNTEFNLSDFERNMIIEVSNLFHQEGKPVIVIINSGSVVETASWKNYPDAIIVAWQPGEEGGNSMADILTGKANPSGKLTMTWPMAASDHPSTKNFPNYDQDMYQFTDRAVSNRQIPGFHFTNHEEDIYVGYRYFDSFKKDVSYPFGYGLSYTTFEYDKPTVNIKGEEITVSVNVKNTGNVAGKEAVQVYVSAPQGSLEKPEKELKAFGKTRTLQPGETETLTMKLQRRDLASYDESQTAWVVDEGTYTFKIGASVADIRCTTTLKVSGMTEKTTSALAPKSKLKLLKR